MPNATALFVPLCGTQQTFGLDKIEPDYERWDKLGLEILPAKERRGYNLVCPPTRFVEDFFKNVLTVLTIVSGTLNNNCCSDDQLLYLDTNLLLTCGNTNIKLPDNC